MTDLEPGEGGIPGVGVHTLTDAEYFDLGGYLSSTGVRELLACPTKFRYNQLHGRLPKRAFDVGHAAHQLVLGAGPELVRIDADKWLSNAVKADVQAVRDRGAVPLRPADWDTVHAMADALADHPDAPRLLSRGKPEQALIWQDDATGVMCRAKADWLRADGVIDYKSADNLATDPLTRTSYNYGYHVQAAFYLRGFRALWPDRVPFFGFIGQEKDPPYLVRVTQLTERALGYGDAKCTEALQVYRDCLAADEWPGYSTEIDDIDLPGWVRTEEYA